MVIFDFLEVDLVDVENVFNPFCFSRSYDPFCESVNCLIVVDGGVCLEQVVDFFGGDWFSLAFECCGGTEGKGNVLLGVCWCGGFVGLGVKECWVKSLCES